MLWMKYLHLLGRINQKIGFKAEIILRRRTGHFTARFHASRYNLPMPSGFRKSEESHFEYWGNKHRFEHWYRDNTVYFITARCRDRRAPFAAENAKEIFWDRFNHWAAHHGFVPWITSLLDNHYHTLGYLKVGEELGPMMRKIHGSVAKLVNDTLSRRHVPFFAEKGHRDYFDGCIRDEIQATRAYRYVLRQSVRYGIVRDFRKYPHTRVNVELELALKRAKELEAYLPEVPYARYRRGGRRTGH